MESPASLEFLEVQVQRVNPVLLVNWAVLVLLVCLEPPVTLDPLASLDPVENKVSPVRLGDPAFPVSAVASVWATLW